MSWWVIPEGTAGKTIGELISVFESGAPPGAQGLGSLFTVTQSTTKPPGAIAGPFATQAEAQAKATDINSGVTSATQPTASNVAASAESGFGISGLFQHNIWLRVAEVAIGVVLLAIGLNAMLKGKPFQVVTGTVGTVGKVVP